MRSSFTNALIRKLLENGQHLIVGSDDGTTCYDFKHAAAAIDEAAQYGMVDVTIHIPSLKTATSEGQQIGWMRLVLANDDVYQLSDYSTGGNNTNRRALFDGVLPLLTATYMDIPEAVIAERRHAAIDALKKLADKDFDWSSDCDGVLSYDEWVEKTAADALAACVELPATAAQEAA